MGAQVTPELIMAFAIAAGGYGDFCKTADCRPPEVRYAQAAFLQELCKANGGCYDRANRRVYINEVFAATPAMTRRGWAMTAHEFTHHLQELAGKWKFAGNPCNVYRSELQAYTVQDKMLASMGEGRVELSSPDHEINKWYLPRCARARDAGLVRDIE